jgi:hypothetical protein
MKVVINTCYGGFSLSRKAVEFMAKRGNEVAIKQLASYNQTKDLPRSFYLYELRADPDLIAAVEELGEGANGELSNLKVVEIPDGIEWYVSEYDGVESIHQDHEIWD